MSLLTDKDFVEGLPSALDLFTMPPCQTSVFQHYYVDVRPVSQITDSSPVEFQIANSGIDYVDLKRSRLHVKLKVSHSDGTVLGKDEQVAPVNLFMQALWSQVAVYLQGQLVSSANNHYPYKAYIQTLLNYGAETKQSQLQSQLFYKDVGETQADIESTDPITGTNSGASDREAHIAVSKTVTMEGPLCEDIFNIGRYLVNGVDMTVKLFQSSIPFCLMSGKSGQEYKIELLDIYFKICKLKMNSALILTHNKLFEKSNALYLFTKTVVKMSSIPSSQQSYVWDSVFQSQFPGKLVVGFVNGDGVSGSYTKNPFNFQSSFVKTVALYLDGVSVPGRPVEADDVSAYVNLFEGVSRWGQDTGNYIQRTEFELGNGLFVFSLEPVFVDSDYLSLLKSGNLRLEVQFKSALTKTVSCIVYGEFPSLIEIDQTRNVYVK
ncbi:uncharacterized protein F54H12.2-like [Gigantopelta aegis]|uniref:uncharacterized protein F54H12.2-like n=1 Tax=Gigantopelta aegis TaxID=1735272 RepID=UPI001B88874E|nr:uncharacterized protein F54H12.2-like [Gigantopelta aegis]